MSRTLRGGATFCGESFAITMRLPDKYFTAEGVPIWHLIYNRLGAQATFHFDKPIGPIPPDEVEQT